MNSDALQAYRKLCELQPENATGFYGEERQVY
jgi:hypothetical protein